MRTEFWKQIPPNEPYRVILGDVRDKLYNTRERSRQLLANGKSDIPENSIFTNAEQVPSLPITFSSRKFQFSIPVLLQSNKMEIHCYGTCLSISPLSYFVLKFPIINCKCYNSEDERNPYLLILDFTLVAPRPSWTLLQITLCLWWSTIADGSLLYFLRQASTFGLSLVRLDIRQESDRDTDILDAITKNLGNGSYREWSEEHRREWLFYELSGKLALFRPDLPKTAEITDVLAVELKKLFHARLLISFCFG